MSLLHRRQKDRHDGLQPAGSDSLTAGPTSQQSAISKVPRRRSSGLKFFASSAAPRPETSKESHKTWEADYLKDLRANRPARPGGSRPLPERAATFTPDPYARASSALSFRPFASTRQPELTPGKPQERCTSTLSHRRAQSNIPSSDEMMGRPVVRQPNAGVSSRDCSVSTGAPQAPSIAPSGTYRENGMRWMERQEARSLREALEDMDLREEAKVHAAAQDEASELVWKHRNKDTLKRDPFKPYNYKQHLEKGAHARSQSIGWNVGPEMAGDSSDFLQDSDPVCSVPDDRGETPPFNRRETTITFKEPKETNHENDTHGGQTHALWDSPQKKAYIGLAAPKSTSKQANRRRSSGLRSRNVSAGLFRNPDDKIYEEPDAVQKHTALASAEKSPEAVPLTSKTPNVTSKLPIATQSIPHSRVASAEDKHRNYRFDIHKNPPSQSRNPSYLKNDRSTPLPDVGKMDEREVYADSPQFRDGKEIRSDDIKAATSMRMKDRSPKLPSPTIVSDRPGRPIVSFDGDWKPTDADKQGNSSPNRPSAVSPKLRFKPHPLESVASAPEIPTINIPDAPSIEVSDTTSSQKQLVPEINISQTSIPSISLPDNPPTSRPLPVPSSKSRPSPANRPLPHHSSTTPVYSSKLHWSPSSRRATAQCAACALPIEGRIVSAASQRFHPGCFSCHHCAEALECVAFYPEPDSARDARLERIEARANGTLVPEDDEKAGETAFEDGDPSLRFYCHLDFHELFSPRCRSCKTPIETEIVLACGASWHVGHFFCAQCGDPFDAKTPFVEKDGYAWCVGCHAGRFSGKCKGCRKPVVEGGVVALGGEWHADCFSCVVSAA